MLAPGACRPAEEQKRKPGEVEMAPTSRHQPLTGSDRGLASAALLWASASSPAERSRAGGRGEGRGNGEPDGEEPETGTQEVGAREIFSGLCYHSRLHYWAHGKPSPDV